MKGETRDREKYSSKYIYILMLQLLKRALDPPLRCKSICVITYLIYLTYNDRHHLADLNLLYCMVFTFVCHFGIHDFLPFCHIGQIVPVHT